MEKINIVKESTLIRKGYLLAGVLMAANMFVVNEVKASSETKNLNNNETTEKKYIIDSDEKSITKDVKIEGEENKKKQGPLYKLLSGENYFNLFGTLALSCANNYFKWWDYNAGGYLKLRIGCLGWRTKKFFDTVQLDFNLNLGRGALWLIPGIFGFMQYRKKEERPIILNSTAGLITMKILYTNEEDFKKNNSGFGFVVSYFIFFILQGFVSAPLTFHIYNFSISISLDSILWEFVIGRFFDEGKKEDIKIDSANKNDDSE